MGCSTIKEDQDDMEEEKVEEDYEEPQEKNDPSDIYKIKPVINANIKSNNNNNKPFNNYISKTNTN